MPNMMDVHKFSSTAIGCVSNITGVESPNQGSGSSVLSPICSHSPNGVLQLKMMESTRRCSLFSIGA